MTEKGLTNVTLSELDQALPDLASGKVDAVVYDAPILRYRVREEFNDQLTVIPGSFQRQDYGFAPPSGSTHREAVNRALLRRLQDPTWDALTYRYLGSRE